MENSLLRLLVRVAANVVNAVDGWTVGGVRGSWLHPPLGKPGRFSTSHPSWFPLR